MPIEKGIVEGHGLSSKEGHYGRLGSPTSKHFICGQGSRKGGCPQPYINISTIRGNDKTDGERKRKP
jgi:hypothetical protein